MKSFRIIICAAAVLMSLALAPAAAALELDEAKARGLVGEMASGYLAAVQEPASAEVKALIQRINNERRNKYSEIAQKRGTSVSAVEALAGKTAIEKTAPGQYVNLGGWRKK
jgi:uncharacterized protein YdbL (DUF1318 family)